MICSQRLTPTTNHHRFRATLLISAIYLSVAMSAFIGMGMAEAAPTATVMANTQRMSDASLTSRQNGIYTKGSKLSLSCYKRGQAVKGYFSKNLPNGGWDNLWYKVSDGYFVADVDIETGTVNTVTGPCDSPAPSPNTNSGSSLSWPLRNISITRGFGNGHDGIDLAASSGTPVYAAADGVVKFEGWGQNNSWMLGQAGICILLRHDPAGIYTGYAHLSRTVINTGNAVKKGQLIGYSGATGQVTGPHLHFEVLPLNPNFRNGYAGRVDPRPYLR